MGSINTPFVVFGYGSLIFKVRADSHERCESD